MKLGGLLLQIARDLNDAAPGHEFTAWSREQIRGYLLEALQVVSDARPDLFAERVLLEVTPCTTIQDICDCEKILDVVGQATAAGRVFKTLRRRSGDPKVRWPGRTCQVPPSKDFTFDEYTVDESTGALELFPPAPPGLELFVLVECVPKAETLGDDADISETASAAAIQWVLYRAKMVDAENNPAVLSAAKTHEDACFTLLIASRRYRRAADGGSS